MISVTKISRLRNLGVFREFDWPQDLPEFKRYNVIYGWNGSGKTLLSRIFARFQKKQILTCEDVVVKFSNGDELRSNSFSSVPANLKVRVFNRDFVEETVHKAEGSIHPIYFFGEKTKEKQQDLEKVAEQITEKRKAIETNILKKDDKKNEIDKLCSNGAQAVRDTLQIPGRQYEREQFREDISTLLGRDKHDDYILDDNEREHLLELIRSEKRKTLNLINFSFATFKVLFDKARKLCRESVVAKVIEEFRQHPDVNVWVEQGLNLHKHYGTETCLFCNQLLTEQRLQDLDAHFSEAYNKLIEEIEKLAGEVRTGRESAISVRMPDPDLLFPGLHSRFTKQQAQFTNEHTRHIQEIDNLIEVLENKRKNPFEDLESTVPAWDITDDAIAAVNEMITEHNTKVDNHQKEVEKAKQRLKHHIIAERIESYQELKNELNTIENALDTLQREVAKLEKQHLDLERDLVENRRPAEELNCEIASYLGHKEIQFNVEETGYRIVRNGQTADSISEGEKTAIAFLYFLKLLQDRDFDIQNGIVVIDDPVSSLDSNALYYAFGFMKNRVKDAGQLFLLTHNFLFFRQVKDWFSFLSRSDVGHYMLEVGKSGGNRNSRLVRLDPLLKDYESEYHYLFSLVYKAANTENGGDLAQYYYLPNVVRRLLEAFLEFKVPGKTCLHKRLQDVGFEDARKERIRRFCETHSHSRVIDEPEQDPVILGEANSIAQDVMDLIRTVDKGHLIGMERLVKQVGQSC